MLQTSSLSLAPFSGSEFSEEERPGPQYLNYTEHEALINRGLGVIHTLKDKWAEKDFTALLDALRLSKSFYNYKKAGDNVFISLAKIAKEKTNSISFPTKMYELDDKQPIEFYGRSNKPGGIFRLHKEEFGRRTWKSAHLVFKVNAKEQDQIHNKFFADIGVLVWKVWEHQFSQTFVPDIYLSGRIA